MTRDRIPVLEVLTVQRDPVCGMKVDPNEAAGTMDFDGRTYYFCSSDCRHKFELNPREYALPRGSTGAEPRP